MRVQGRGPTARPERNEGNEQVREVVVVGASLAGLRAAEALRREGYDGRLTLIGAEDHLPYDRPPLSKQFLAGEAQADDLALRRTPYDELDLELRLGVRASALDLGARQVALADSTWVRAAYDAGKPSTSYSSTR